jgi:hypothetical protein
MNDLRPPMHVYEVRPRKDHRGVDLISDAMPYGRLWCCEVSDAFDYAKFYITTRGARGSCGLTSLAELRLESIIVSDI